MSQAKKPYVTNVTNVTRCALYARTHARRATEIHRNVFEVGDVVTTHGPRSASLMAMSRTDPPEPLFNPVPARAMGACWRYDRTQQTATSAGTCARVWSLSDAWLASWMSGLSSVLAKGC